MKAEIITIGTEIMVGSILNTNSKYLSNKLIELGIETYYHTSVDDNAERLASIIEIALSRADIIITTGGLGPTQDDLTKEIVSKVLKLELIHDTEVEENIVDMFKRINKPMTVNNLKQTFKPNSSKLIKNDKGTAPGIYIDKNNVKIIMLPGPPNELIPMFENYIADLIKDDYKIVIRSINTIDIGESALEVELKNLDIYEENFDIATFATEDNVEIKIIGRGMDKEEITDKIEQKISKIKDKIGDYIYGYDNISLAEVVINKLKLMKHTLSLCESCTGGAISSMITSIPGASCVFDRGIVTYSNNSKIDELGVKPITLKTFGAVSEETAYEMAKGLIDKTNSDIVLSITGIAGPGGGTVNKPVGLVYMCTMDNTKHKVTKYIFTGNRTTIQEKATIKALSEINNFLQTNN